MTLKVDDREPTHLQNCWDFETEVERREVGDYVVNKVAIERKEINDLVSSLNGRLWEQLKILEDNIENGELDAALLLVHGTVSDLNSRHMEPRKIEGIYGALARVSISYDVTVIWVREESQFKKFVRKVHNKAGTDTSKNKPHLTKRNYRDDRVNVLYGIPGIGNQTAQNLLEEFDSIAEICQASKQDLQRADGVGAKGAKKIYDILHDGEEENLLA